MKGRSFNPSLSVLNQEVERNRKLEEEQNWESPQGKRSAWYGTPKSRSIEYMWKSSIPDKWIYLLGEDKFINKQKNKKRDTLAFLMETQKYIHKICKSSSYDLEQLLKESQNSDNLVTWKGLKKCKNRSCVLKPMTQVSDAKIRKKRDKYIKNRPLLNSAFSAYRAFVEKLDERKCCTRVNSPDQSELDLEVVSRVPTTWKLGARRARTSSC
ncbi:unnamed protein product [Blepharisma stoltei]|uniref:Uncharacterized protein n=1 Tax=Blepharisma stoltei TaxID=1481888 RepID=A0AAU9IJ09_9CILI|nr:unnamed protein product [Blepharisma stoltei]